MLGIDEQRYWAVRFFREPATQAWKDYEPWVTTIVDLDTGQVLGIVDDRDSDGEGFWSDSGCSPSAGVAPGAYKSLRSTTLRRSARPCRCGCHAPRSSMDAFHLAKLGNDTLTEVRQHLTQQVHGGRGRSGDPVWANRKLLFRADDTLSRRARERLSNLFDTDDVTANLRATWLVQEKLRALLAIGSRADAAAAKNQRQALVVKAAHPETNRLWRTVCRWRKDIEVLIATGATTALNVGGPNQ
ncbi:hypothetical protein QF038_004447 [Pseudarthrobacter sp. W1I19]|uniref:transposase n=1 Tax=Pseudarthrobacter sp. W1I19 TaxID=3042288 RepID=UPI002787FAF1|nr:transposase [Pseudarthrobacter sp. W1I19]MDQ0925939.1 hypothetical protein [Pseudarthrobacter sp. W1I19]